MIKHSDSGTLLLEKYSSLAAAFLRQYRLPFCASLFFGFLAYGFALTNKLVNHDEVASLFTKGATVTSGRWGLGALDSIFPNYSMPWIYGLITMVLVTLSVCLMVGIFRIRNRLLQCLLSGCVTVFPSLIGLFGYMFTSCSFAFSFFLAVCSAALLQTRNKWFLVPALGCLVLSLSIYQAYISVAAGLLVLVLIQQLLQEESPAAVLARGIGFVVFLIVSLGLYWLGTEIVLRITGNQLNNYASEKIAFSLSSVLQGAVLAYRNFLLFFTGGLHGLIPTGFSRYLHWIFMAAIGILLIIHLLAAAKEPCRILLLVLLTAILPLAINCMYMITTEDSIHTLVLYGFVAVYLLAILLADRLLSNPEPVPLTGAILNILTVVMAVIIVANTYIANQAYLQLYLRYENAAAFYTSLIADLKMMPDFTEDTKLAIIGEYQQPEYYYEQFEQIHGITGIYGFLPDNYSNNFFLEYYTGFPIDFATGEEIAQITVSPEFGAMAVYPYYGSLQKIGNILVVKLS